ncbi:hypothetical protein Plhal703r1_c23g0099011 [Plasmopara halstedii]
MQTARIGSSIHYLHLSELWNGHIRSLVRCEGQGKANETCANKKRQLLSQFESYAFDKFLYEAPYTDFLLTLTLVP